jgi:L-ascorbate metabolism protein UlaG (beta-lactamase superfamily)
MELRYMRHATLVIDIGGKRILVDPMLADQGSLPALPAAARNARNPLISLPADKSEILRGIEAVLITHAHFDHFDAEAERLLPKDIALFCQPADAAMLRKKGFTRIMPVADCLERESLTIQRFPAHHGKGFLGVLMGKSSSYLIRVNGESLFLSGDAVLDASLRAGLALAMPRCIVANAGAARFLIGSPITLDAPSLAELARAYPEATIVAVHMDALNHCGLTKQALRAYLSAQALQARILVPEEGEAISL